MDREGFLEQVRHQYMERISAVYVQAEHEHGEVDYGFLSAQLLKLKKGAAAEGIGGADFDEMVRSVLPDLDGKVDLSAPIKKAA
jgi:hypothetical protein